ncbi:C-C chemokine receptor type 8-like, partial [Epinephelus moara]|uniref:C-C chemokine receptor type 8-like n=1 Tax=Epinephelus moara TaxID=300413 RepID=UPI00214E4167
GGVLSSFHLFIAVCCCLIVCISIPANSLLLWGLLRERAWKTASDILLLQLTISDLFFTVSLPFEAYQLLHGWIIGLVACKVLRGVFFLGLNSYVLILTAMTRYNYVTVCRIRGQRQASRLITGMVVVFFICLAPYNIRHFIVSLEMLRVLKISHEW